VDGVGGVLYLGWLSLRFAIPVTVAWFWVSGIELSGFVNGCRVDGWRWGRGWWLA